METKLTKWFHINLAKGCDSKELKSLALKAGYSKKDISSCFSAAKSDVSRVSIPSQFPLHMLAMGLVLLIGILGTYFFLFMAPPGTTATATFAPAGVGSIPFTRVAFKQAQSIFPLAMFLFVLMSVMVVIFYKLRARPFPGMPPGP